MKYMMEDKHMYVSYPCKLILFTVSCLALLELLDSHHGATILVPAPQNDTVRALPDDAQDLVLVHVGSRNTKACCFAAAKHD